ncbi:MAG: NUDIX hydrolase [Aridibacter sp.]
MFKKIIEKVWKFTPYGIRLRAVRLIQKKFTASVVAIITNEKNEILILDHRFRFGASWGLPGGFIERDENPEDAIKRELKEETNLKLENLRLIKVRTIGKHLEVIFSAKGVGRAKVNSQEIKEVGWFALDKLPEEMSKIQKELVMKLVKEIL